MYQGPIKINKIGHKQAVFKLEHLIIVILYFRFVQNLFIKKRIIVPDIVLRRDF